MTENEDQHLQMMNTGARKDDESKENDKTDENQIKRWKILAMVFGVFFLVILIAFIVMLIFYLSQKGGTTSPLRAEADCSKLPELRNEELATKSNSIYSSLSQVETQEVMKFLMSDGSLRLVPIENATLGKNYIYSIEAYLPNKQDAIAWLDDINANNPKRGARVLLFMGELKEVHDYIVWPIPKPESMETAFVNRPDGKMLTWKSRPICNVIEEPVVETAIWAELEQAWPAFNESFMRPSCEEVDDCIWMQLAVRSVLNSPKRHLHAWFYTFDERVEDYYMYPVPMYVVVSASTNDTYRIEKLYYNNIEFDSVSDLVSRYNSDPSIHYKAKDISASIGLYGSPRYLMDGVTEDQTRGPPIPVYPEGSRFRVEGQYVEWLKWSFTIRSRTITAGQLFDVRFDGERIAYEISMQEILVLYAGNIPDNFFKSYFDDGWAIGRYNTPLTRNVDCPPGAVYLNSRIYSVSNDKSIEIKDAYCVFEHRNSVPLRRHFSTEYLTWGYRYAFSMPDTVLVVRQMLTVWNYDYIFDYEFHQNGMVEAKVSSTGYIAVSSASNPTNIRRGYVVNPDFNHMGNLHQHLFSFKLDVDVGGVENRFKTIDIKAEEDATSFANDGEWSQMFMVETPVTKESEATIKYNFDTPKYYVVENNQSSVHPNSDSPLPRGYRVVANGFSKVVLADDSPLMKGGASWAKYQLAVTKQNDNERGIASYFVQGDPFDPQVDFDAFIANDDSLVDVDLVVWATVGIHHVPTYEDLPVTTTPGKTVGVALSPFNYFERDPSIHSRDAAVFYNRDWFPMENDFLTSTATCPANVSKPIIRTGFS